MNLSTTNLLDIIESGITPFCDHKTRTIYTENVAYDASSHSDECRRCRAEKALSILRRVVPSDTQT